MSKNANANALIIGFAMFAVFFGAGNLVFPPLIGLMSGSSWEIAIIGLAISAILFPIATIIAVDNMGGTVKAICAPVAKWFTKGYMVMWIIFILTCGVPRQAGVGIEKRIDQRTAQCIAGTAGKRCRPHCASGRVLRRRPGAYVPAV